MEDTVGSTQTVLGTCHHDCPDSCGWVATVQDSVVVKLRGNPSHPYSQGELCPKVNRFVDRTYNPERITTPLIRIGAKGAGEFREATWSEAITEVVSHIQPIVDAGYAHRIFPWFSAGTQGAIQASSLDRTLFARLGAAKMVGSVCGVAAGVGAAATYGPGGRGADPLNLVHAELVILWATNTRLTNRHLWSYVEEARSAGARIVCIDPMRTLTADAADWFLQPLPGTDVALMLSMMHVLIKEEMIDREYVDAHALGFEELAEHVGDWKPERAAEVTGLEATDIVELARAYGRARPAFIRTLIGGEHHRTGGMFYRALNCLPVLTGSWRHLGGGVARSVGSWQEMHDVDLAVFDADELSPQPRRELNQNDIGDLLCAEGDDAIEALFVWGGNPVVSIPNAGATRRGLARDDLFTVVSEQFMTDTARFADVVFPAATQLEQYDVVPSWGHLWLGYNHKAAEPVGEAVPNTELWRRLAGAFNFDDAVFSKTDEELIEMVLVGVDLDELRSQGFVRIAGTEELMPYAEGGFATASGKAELINPALAELGLSVLPDYTSAPETLGDADGNSEFPLQLVSPKQQTRFLNSSYSGMAGHRDREPAPTLSIDAKDAADRGIQDGDTVTVRNGRAALTLPAQISDRLRPGIVSVPWGWWSLDHPDGVTVNDLTSPARTDMGGGASYGDTMVQVCVVPKPHDHQTP